MTMRKVLLIDDDVELANLLRDFLSRYEISCQCAHTGEAGLRLLREKRPEKPLELIILDIMLPDISGFDLCQNIRRESSLPIVMLSARGDVYDRILGLELGADDYLPKPFEPRELLARMESVLRRHQPAASEVLTFKELRIHMLT